MSTQNEWGLTERGFRRPTYTELLDALEYKARELFGSKANLTVRSPIGLFLRIFAWILNMLFSTIEDVYNSRFVDTAVGTSLYNLGKAIGLKLLSEQKSSGYLQITGTPGTIVPVGWLAGTVAGLQFVVMAQGEIGTGGTVLLPAQATTAGPEGNVAAGTVTVVINPGIPEGITAVTNPAAFDGGRARETDEEYRDRYYQSVDYAGGVNADAIRGEILQNVEGVYSAIVYENDTDETDSEASPRTASRLSSTAGSTATSRSRFSGARRQASRPTEAPPSPSCLPAASPTTSNSRGRPSCLCGLRSQTSRRTPTASLWTEKTKSRRPSSTTSAAT